jgi:hypothetical protein
MDKGENHEINNHQGMKQDRYHHNFLTFILTVVMEANTTTPIFKEII